MIIYVGIDVGKRNHEAGIINGEGKQIGKTLRISNTMTGFQCLNDFIQDRIKKITGEQDSSTDELSVHIGMEATGHYWKTLYTYLEKVGYKISVINPIQTEKVRKVQSIRKAKTDKIDAIVIANTLRINQPEQSVFADPDRIAIQKLSRIRRSIVESCTRCKLQGQTIMDQIFPEYESIFDNIYSSSSITILKKCCTPKQMKEASINELTSIISKTSRGWYGADKAGQIIEAAQSSIGTEIAAEADILELNLLIAQIEMLEKQIKVLDAEIDKYMAKIKTTIFSIPGIGKVWGTTIISEVGDINRFSNSAKFVAFTGLDPSIHQSGDSSGLGGHISKRGSPHLRWAIYEAAECTRRFDPVFKAYYDKKRSEGKSHRSAVCACALKLTRVIYSILKTNKEYVVDLAQLGGAPIRSNCCG